jgi:hypothetical protein
MTEAEWLATVEPEAMLDHYCQRASQRKLRLAAVACVRQVSKFLSDRWSREAIETAERFADRAVDRHDFAVARVRSTDAVAWAEERASGEVIHAARAALAVTLEDCTASVRESIRHARAAAGVSADSTFCAVLRDVFGNPFKTSVVEHWWLGRDGEIKMMARSLYDAHRFAELPALADALATAGCRDSPLPGLLGSGHSYRPHLKMPDHGTESFTLAGTRHFVSLQA